MRVSAINYCNYTQKTKNPNNCKPITKSRLSVPQDEPKEIMPNFKGFWTAAGAGSGALVGMAFGGPLGALAGAAIGALVGKPTDDDDKYNGGHELDDGEIYATTHYDG